MISPQKWLWSFNDTQSNRNEIKIETLVGSFLISTQLFIRKPEIKIFKKEDFEYTLIKTITFERVDSAFKSHYDFCKQYAEMQSLSKYENNKNN